MDENTSIAISISSIAVVIASISMFGCYQYEETKRTAMESGLEQRQASGRDGWYWAAPEHKTKGVEPAEK